ncbi:hypothetical protein KVV02_000395 [Mortierella alpina]|uniref:DDB1- and CUL4-associated factor 12 beta-propeller domain-containing protein n=1 Tax=Mortierella alpina TaxID=64518 RepID=A0A9P8D2R3_MORAP|nr:hypothetical protein KVV02_000395 [Mortierella alpina]
MPILKLPFLQSTKDPKQPWSYNAATTEVPSSSILAPLRKRECQTRQQQVRQGTPRRIGCTPRPREEYPIYDSCIISPSRSPDMNQVGAGSGIVARSGTGVEAHRCTLKSMTNSSTFPSIHHAAESITPSSGRCTEADYPSSGAMDWASGDTHAERRRKAVRTTATSSLSKSAAAYGKSFMMMGQAMGFGTYACPANPSSTASSVPRELTNSHLSVAQFGGGGRRMSTPSMPSPPQMPYYDSRASNVTASCRSSSMAPRPNSALSNARTWIASSPSGSLRTSSDESNGYYNVGNGQSDSGSVGSPTAIYGYRPSDQTVDLVSSRIPPLLAEREYKVEGLDKVFAVTWLSSEEVLLGTKCNKLIVLNTRTRKQLTLGRLEECLLSSVTSESSRIEGIAAAGSGSSSPLSSRSPTTGSPNTRVYGASYLSSNSRQGSVSSGITNGLERGLRFFNPGRRSSTPSFTMAGNALAANRPYATDHYIGAMATTTTTTAAANRSPAPTPNTASLGSRSPSASPNSSTGAMHAMAAASTSTGVRSISVNPSRTLIAIGAGEPFQVTIYSLPEFESVGVMYGHSDLVFSLTWASDTVLVTGSRDGSMRVWSMDSPVVTTLPAVGQPIEVRLHSIAQTEDKTKVRDLSLNRGTGELMTLSTDGYVKLWDRESFNQASKMKLKYTQETVCLTSNPDANLFAVGSQSHISVIDPRTPSIVHVADSCDEGWGVRSLDFKSHIITSGGGYGRVGFYDLRAQRYLDGFGDNTDRAYHEIGQGWLNRDTAYAGSIMGFQIRNAIYAMEYDSTGTRLFTAGGPLQLGLCGAYAALWSYSPHRPRTQSPNPASRMATRWDASREYDSQTFSEDYNLHDASDRSHDHPSVTRDDDFFGALNLQNQDGDDQDYGSLEDADLDLIADIVDGKAPHQSTQRRRPLRAAAHQTDDNSAGNELQDSVARADTVHVVTSLFRYVLDGSQEDIDFHESSAFDPTRPPLGNHMDQLVPLADDADEDHFREWSGSTPKRQTRSALDYRMNSKASSHIDYRMMPKASPKARRQMPSTHQSLESIARSTRHMRTVSIDEGLNSSTPRSGNPARSLPVPPTMTAAMPERILAERKGVQDRNIHVKEIPKPIVRSAMKPPNNSQSKALPTKVKLVRHIQLPTELFDDSDQEDASRIKDQGRRSGLEEDKENLEETKPAVPEVPVATEVLATPAIPGPSRFTRMSKKNVSPAKKPLATIPTPQDDDANEVKNDDLEAKEEEEQEQVSKNVQELKRVLRTLRLPLTETLETSLDVLDAAAVKKGGLCEMMGLMLQLGGMYEKKEEVLHQMTDQIIAHQEQPRADPTADKKIQKLSQELEAVKHDLAISQKECHALEIKSNGLTTELERVNKTKDEEAQQDLPRSEKRQLLDAASQVSGTWGSIQELHRLETSSPSSKVAQQTQDVMLTNWQGHVLRIEHELKGLKAVLDSSSALGMSTATTEVLELEAQLESALLDNRRLQIKNRTLTKELLSLHEEAADVTSRLPDEHGQSDAKYKPLIQAVMAGLGVKSHHNIMPVLEEIGWILQDVPKLRRFIASIEKIVWESEILERTVKVRSLRGIDKDHIVDGKADIRIMVGRTCSMAFEETLQRLKEWSELLDVLNHVEFAEDIEDTATLVQT